MERFVNGISRAVARIEILFHASIFLSRYAASGRSAFTNRIIFESNRTLNNISLFSLLFSHRTKKSTKNSYSTEPYRVFPIREREQEWWT